MGVNERWESAKRSDVLRGSLGSSEAKRCKLHDGAVTKKELEGEPGATGDRPAPDPEGD